MNDFNQFLNLLRNEQAEKEKQPQKQTEDSASVAPARPVVPMKGELARSISADLSDFLEAVEEKQPLPQEKSVTPAAVEEEKEDVPVPAEEPAEAAEETERVEEIVKTAASAGEEDPVQLFAIPDEPIINPEKTRVVHDLSQVPVSTESKPAPGSVSAEKTVVVHDRTRPLLPDDVALSAAQQEDSHFRSAPVFAPEKEIAEPVDGKTRALDGKGNLLRAIARTARESEQADGQIMMEGFDANDPVQTDEQTMEAELRTVREKRIEEFGLPKDSEPVSIPEHSEPPKTKTLPLPPFLTGMAEKFADRETPFVDAKTEEYRMPEDRRRVSTALRDAMRHTTVKTGIQAGLGLILLLTNLITTVSANNNNGFFTVFGASVKGYAVFNLIFFLASAVLLLPDFKNAVMTALKLRARTEAALLGMYLLVFAQNIALFFTELQPEHDYHMFTGACVMLGALYTASKIFWIKNTRYCFKQAGVTENKLYLRSIRDSQALRTLLCENNVDGVCVDFTLKTRFVSDFLKRSCDAARSAMPRSILTPVLGIACVLCGLVAALVQGSPVSGISAAAGAACLSFPVCGVVIGSLLLCETNRALSDKKACVGSLRDARNVVTADHLAFGGKDLFRVKLVNTATVDGVSEKAAALTAAILAKKAGDTMAAAFSPVLAEYDRRLPSVEEFSVEEKLGVCAWVDNCRVLLGNEQMLINHNVRPGKVQPLPENEHYLYLAIEGNAVAVFTLQYVCRENLSVSLNAVSKTGVNLLVRTNDPNLTEEMIQQAAALPDNSVRIVPKAGSELFDRLYDNVSDRESAGIIGAGGFQSLCDAVGKAVSLDRSGRTVSYICTASSVVGAGAALLLCATGNIGKASGWSAVLLQLIWNAAAFILPQLLYKLSDLKNTGLKKLPVRIERTDAVATTQPEAVEAPPQPQPTEQANEKLNFVLSNGFAPSDEE